MSKRAESIELTFENLDYIHIPVEYFGEFRITGIRTTVERLAANAILQRTQVEQVEFELLAQVDAALSDMSRDLSFLPEERLSLLKRIENRKDIACLDIYYDDGSSDQIYLPWEDTQDDRHNRHLRSLLRTKRNKNGNLTIAI